MFWKTWEVPLLLSQLRSVLEGSTLECTRCLHPGQDRCKPNVHHSHDVSRVRRLSHPTGTLRHDAW